MIVRYRYRRVVLSPFKNDEESLLKYQEWLSDESFNNYYGQHNKVMTTPKIKEYIDGCASSKERLYFNIYVELENRMIGFCYLEIQNNTNAEIGIYIGDSKYHNRKFGEETLKALIQFSFEQLGMHRCVLTCYEDNIRGMKCYQRCGFKICGCEHDVVWWKGKWHNVVTMEYLYDDYVGSDLEGVKSDS